MSHWRHSLQPMNGARAALRMCNRRAKLLDYRLHNVIIQNQDTNGYFSQHENGAQQPSFIHFGSCKRDSTALPHETQSAFDCPPLLSMITFSLNSICAISLSFAFQQTQHQKEYEGRTCQCDADRLSKQSTAKELTRYPSSGHQDGDPRPCNGFSV